jgi:hypothetical protein
LFRLIDRGTAMQTLLLALLFAVVLVVALGVAAFFLFTRRGPIGGFIEDGPARLADTRSLGDLIKAGRAPVHIVFVHGMRANGAGGSAAFRAALIRRLGGADDAEGDLFTLDVGDWPRGATLSGQKIWRTAEEWAASRPFVHRYKLTLGGGQIVIVDEVNWWPLLFPLKSRFLLLNEHRLSGGDEAHLKLCRDHRWISDEEYRAAIARPPAGPGARLNAGIKREILNWGLSDAVIALGPMRTHINRAMRRAFALADECARAADARERVIIAESLGSFAVLDSADPGPVRTYLDQTHDLYFLANQFALLELARIDGLERTDADAGTLAEALPGPPSSPLARLAEWGMREPALELVALSEEPWRPRQVIALNDPNDLLTYYVPGIQDVKVVNVLVRNARPVLGLLAHPVDAHSTHAANPAVWDVLLGPGPGA